MSNFLDMQCPKCGRDDGIDIQATVWVRVMEDGTDADASRSGGCEFEPTNPAECGCGYCGKVADFVMEEAESFIGYWSALDAALKASFDIDTSAMGLSADEIAAHQEAGETPDEVARHYGGKYGLRSLVTAV